MMPLISVTFILRHTVLSIEIIKNLKYQDETQNNKNWMQILKVESTDWKDTK